MTIKQEREMVAGIMALARAATYQTVVIARETGFALTGTTGYEELQAAITALSASASRFQAENARLMRVVEAARAIQRAMGERPVDITNETRWELDPSILNVVVWELNALDAATAPPDGEDPL